MTGRSISSPTSSSSLNPSMSGMWTSLITRSNMVLFSLNNFNAVIAFLVVVTEKSIAKINIILKEQNCIPQIQPEHKIYVLFIKKIQSKEKFCILHPMKPCLSGSEGRKNRKSENKETTENQKKK